MAGKTAAWSNRQVNYTAVSAASFAELDGLSDWRVIFNGARAEFRLGTFEQAATFLSAVATLAESSSHHPDMTLRYPDRVGVFMTTHATGGLSDADVSMARQISDAAHRLGGTSEPSITQAVEIAIDTTDPDRIRPFWAAVLDYKDVDGALVDPRGTGPGLWFQHMDEPRTDRDRFHIDIAVPHDQAEARVAAAVAAGGQLVTDKFARSWWVLADLDGNEACICTWQDR